MRTTNRASEKKYQTPIDLHISKKKYEALVSRLADLEQKKPALAKEVADLATLGDFSENFEYQQAKHELRRVTNQIIKLRHRIDSAIIITPQSSHHVTIGSTVTVIQNGTEMTYTILGSSEVDIARGIISHTSPIGSALLGNAVGDTVIVRLPTKTLTMSILALE